MKTMQADLSATLERNNAAFERLRTDMANQKAWIAALVFGAVVSGITLGISFAV